MSAATPLVQGEVMITSQTNLSGVILRGIDPAQGVAMGVFEGGQVKITSTAYSWEGVAVADLSPDTLETLEVPADAELGDLIARIQALPM